MSGRAIDSTDSADSADGQLAKRNESCQPRNKKLRAPPPKAGGSWNDLDATDEHDETEAANVLREFFSPKVNSCKCASVRGPDRVAC